MFRKVLIRKPGGYDRLEVVEGEIPRAAANEVVVETTSIGVNFADVVVRIGLYPSAKEYVGWPITPGFEFAGRVLSVGSGVTRFASGDLVIGVSRFGGYASHVLVHEDYLSRLPEALAPEIAGGFPVAFLTAYYALVELGAVRRGHKVLVHSAAGAVGSALVRLAKIAGAEVIAVVGSTKKIEAARALGADHVIDKSREKLFERVRSLAPSGLDIALDANGYETLGGSYAALRPTGRLVIYGAHTMLSRGSARPNWLKLAYTFLRTPRFDPLRLTNENKAVFGFNLSYLFEEREKLAEVMPILLGHVEAGRLGALPTQSLPLEKVGEAHRLLQSGTTIGKIVLLP